MGFVDKTPEGRYRAYFRDPTGKQRSRTFKVKKDATAFLAEMETSKSRGTYVSPHAGRTLFGEHARRWMETRNTEAMTTARDRSIIATHVLPRWGDVPLGRVDDIGLRGWVTELGRRRSRATVSKALQLTAAVLRSAVRNRLIPFTQPRRCGFLVPGSSIPGSGLSVGRICERGYSRHSPSVTAPSWQSELAQDCGGARQSGYVRMPWSWTVRDSL